MQRVEVGRSSADRVAGEPGASVPSRAAGLDRLAAFAPRAAAYAAMRNRVAPPHDAVSRLSPYVRHRLVLERELVAAAWAHHPQATVDRFVTEVLWRTYWKGWLESRPTLWHETLAQTPVDLDGLGGAEANTYRDACAGRTGIEPFDDWLLELQRTGYLHNHARMWFASIWIFTLGLPWRLGAALFLRHLLDGDVASNTLSWRWVAGLHTKGKHYLARAENIARYTGGRYCPRGLLNESAGCVQESRPPPAPRPIAPTQPLDPGCPSGLLLTPEDLAVEHSALAGLPIVAIAAGWDCSLEAELDLAAPVIAFARGALMDGLERGTGANGADRHWIAGSDWLASAESWALGLGVRQVVAMEPPVGPWRDRLDRLGTRLAEQGMRLVLHRRAWDRALWPAATKGFFPFRAHALDGGRLEGLVPDEPRDSPARRSVSSLRGP